MRRNRIYNVSSCCERKKDIVQYYMLKDTDRDRSMALHVPSEKEGGESQDFPTTSSFPCSRTRHIRSRKGLSRGMGWHPEVLGGVASLLDMG